MAEAKFLRKDLLGHCFDDGVQLPDEFLSYDVSMEEPSTAVIAPLDDLPTPKGTIANDVLESLQPQITDVRNLLSSLGLNSYSNYILSDAIKEALKAFKRTIPSSIPVPDGGYPFCGSGFLRWPCFDPLTEVNLPVSTDNLSIVGMQVLAHRHLVVNIPKNDDDDGKKSKKLCLICGEVILYSDRKYLLRHLTTCSKYPSPPLIVCPFARCSRPVYLRFDSYRYHLIFAHLCVYVPQDMILGWSLPGCVVHTYDGVLKPLVDDYIAPYLRSMNTRIRDKESALSYVAKSALSCFGPDPSTCLSTHKRELVATCRTLLERDCFGRPVQPPVTVSPPTPGQEMVPDTLLNTVLPADTPIQEPNVAPDIPPSSIPNALVSAIQKVGGILDPVVVSLETIAPQLDPLQESVINLTQAVVDLKDVLTGLRGDVRSLSAALRDAAPLVPSPARSASPFFVDPIQEPLPIQEPRPIKPHAEPEYRDPPPVERLVLPPPPQSFLDSRTVVSEPELQLLPDDSDLEEPATKRVKQPTRSSPRLAAKRPKRQGLVTYLRLCDHVVKLPDVTLVAAEVTYAELVQAGAAKVVAAHHDRPPQSDSTLNTVPVNLRHLLSRNKLKSIVVKK